MRYSSLGVKRESAAESAAKITLVKISGFRPKSQAKAGA